LRRRALLSRAAECLFWAFRYVERAENIARAIDVNLNLTLDQPGNTADQWAPLYQVTGEEIEFVKRYEKATPANVMRFLTFDSTYSNSILSCLLAARENARSVREVISSEMWEQMNKFYLFVQSASETGRALRNPSDFYREVRTASHLLEGLTAATMSHSEAWQFVRMGRMVERADQTSRILDVKYFILLPQLNLVNSPVDDVQWMAVLKSCSGFEMYRKQYGRLLPMTIVEFLLLDREFPRAVLYCLNSACDCLHRITGFAPDEYLESEVLLEKLRSDLSHSATKQIMNSGLHEFIDGLQGRLNGVGAAIHSDFFAPSDLPAKPNGTRHASLS